MGKNPSFQFYPNDWSRDLEEHSLEIEGAWIRICCKLWWSDTRGSATKSLEHWARVLRTNKRKATKILEYLKEHDIGTIEIEDEIAITSRRMVNDAKLAEIRKASGSQGGNPDLTDKYNIPGYVYLASRPSDGAIKIGIALNPQQRIYKIRHKIGEDIRLDCSILVDNMGLREKELHERYKSQRIQGEWFLLDEEQIEEIRNFLKGKGKGEGGQNPTPSSSSSSSSSLYTLLQVKDAANLVGLTEQDAQEFFDYFEAQKWKWPNSQLVGELRASLQRWKRNQPRFELKEQKNGRTPTIRRDTERPFIR